MPSPGPPGSGDTSFDSDSPIKYNKQGPRTQPTSSSVREKISKLANLGVDWVLPKQDAVIVEGGKEKLNLKDSLISGQSSPRSPASPMNSGVISGGDLGTPANSGLLPPTPTLPHTGGDHRAAAHAGSMPPTPMPHTYAPQGMSGPPPPQPVPVPQTYAPQGGPPHSYGPGFDQSNISDHTQQFSFGEGEAQWGDIPMEGEAVSPPQRKKKKKDKKDRDVTFGEAEEVYDEDGESRVAVAPEILEVILTFVPGPLGIDADFATTGKLYTVLPGGQAAQAGVIPGWRMIKINGQDYSELLLDQCIDGDREYTITFQCKDPPERDETAENGSTSPSPEDGENQTTEDQGEDASGRPGRPDRLPVAAQVPQTRKKKSGFRFFCCGSKPKHGTLSDDD